MLLFLIRSLRKSELAFLLRVIFITPWHYDQTVLDLGVSYQNPLLLLDF